MNIAGSDLTIGQLSRAKFVFYILRIHSPVACSVFVFCARRERNLKQKRLDGTVWNQLGSAPRTNLYRTYSELHVTQHLVGGMARAMVVQIVL